MKVLVVLFTVFSSLQSFALTKDQKSDLYSEAWSILRTQGIEIELSPEITDFDYEERRDLVDVAFQAVEFGPFYYNCRFTYNLEEKAVVDGSVDCF